MRKIKFRAWWIDKGIMINDYASNPFSYLRVSKWDDVVPKVKLMQYTGLTDKNGKEIYEGDICKTVISSGSPLGTLDVVKYCNGGFRLVDIEDRLLPINFDNSDIISIEIIGNVFQNGELLHDS